MSDKRKWEDLTPEDRIDAITNALTRVGSDVALRDRCLTSKEAAKAAIEEAAEIELPADHQVEFLTKAEAQKRLIFYLPDFNNPPPLITRRAEELTPCSYSPWAPRQAAQEAMQQWLNAP